MPNNEMDYSLIHRTPDGNGKILVTTPGSPDKGSWETEAELKAYVNQDVVMQTDIAQTLGQQIDKVPSNKAVDDAINAVNTRVTNIEETLMGENEATVQYPDDVNYSSLMPNRVPLRALKYAEVPRFRGKSRAWNQQCHPVIPDWWYTEFGATVSYSDGIATLTPHYQYGRLSQDYPYIANHVLLISVKIKLSNATNGNLVSAGMYGFVGTIDGSFDCKATTDWQTVTFIGSTNTASSANRLCVTDSRTSDWGTIQIKDFICRDLTLIFPEGVPSTIAECVQKCPDLLKYNAYDAGSLVDTEVSGARSTSINIWDEQWEVGGINSVSGANDNSVSNRIRSKNFIPVSQSTAYYITCPQENYVFFYDANHNYMNRYEEYHNNYFETYTASYIKICPVSSYGTTYQNNITIAKGSTAVTYRPHILDTLSLSTPVTLRSAGSVAEVLTLETGKKTRPIGTVDVGTLAWIGSNGEFYVLDADGWIEFPEENTEAGNLICAKYVTKSYVEAVDKTIFTTWKSAGVKGLFVKDSSYSDAATFKTAMSGIYINYELATPLSDEQVCNPVPDNFLEVEGGGTIDTIQDQTPVIDNCLDVTYDIL